MNPEGFVNVFGVVSHSMATGLAEALAFLRYGEARRLSIQLLLDAAMRMNELKLNPDRAIKLYYKIAIYTYDNTIYLSS